MKINNFILFVHIFNTISILLGLKQLVIRIILITERDLIKNIFLSILLFHENFN